MLGRFFSTRNDFKIAILYIVIFVLLVLVVEAVFYDPTAAKAGTEDDEISPSDEEEEEPVFIFDQAEVLSTSGHTSEGGTSTEVLDLDYPKVKHIEVRLSWTDDHGNNDNFKVTLLRDGTTIRSEEGDTGTITLSEEDPEGALNGSYEVQIEALDCPGAVGGLPIDRDDGNSWDLSVTAEVGTPVEGER
jgi:hypothetical protein